MAGAGYKLFNTGDVLTAQQVNEYLMQQTVMVFADAAARTTALSGVLAEGMLSYLKSTDSTEVYNGSAWVALAADQTPLTTKGDLFTYTTADARLASSNVNGDILTVDTSTASGLKWAAPAAAGAYTSLASGTLSGTAVNLSSINGTYRDLVLVINNPYLITTGSRLAIRINGSTASNYNSTYLYSASATPTMNGTDTAWRPFTLDNLPTASTTSNSLRMVFAEYASANPYKIFTATGWNNTNNSGFLQVGHNSAVTAAITEINITTSAGSINFGGGTYTLYGVK